jgi:hypothetical protein
VTRVSDCKPYQIEPGKGSSERYFESRVFQINSSAWLAEFAPLWRACVDYVYVWTQNTDDEGFYATRFSFRAYPFM